MPSCVLLRKLIIKGDNMPIKPDEGIVMVDRLLEKLGFQREQDEPAPLGRPRQLTRVRYLDEAGNEVRLDFALQLAAKASGLAIKAVYNRNLSRTWNSVEALVNEISHTVQRWQKTPSGARVDTVSSPRAAAEASKVPGRRLVSARAVANDVRAGMDDASLMKKYGISQQRLLSVLARLVWENFLTHEEIEERRSLAKTSYMAVYQCRLCKEIHFEPREECPKCGGPMANLNRRDLDFD